MIYAIRSLHWKLVLHFDDQDYKLVMPPKHFPVPIFCRQDWENQRMHIQTHSSSFCHVKLSILCRVTYNQSCSCSFKRYALLLYTMHISSFFMKLFKTFSKLFLFYHILIHTFSVSKSTVFVSAIAFAASINQSPALLNS